MKYASKSTDLLAWATTLETGVLEAGRSLAQWQTADAQQVGVRFPRRVRVLLVDAIPAPGDPELRAAAESCRFLDGRDGHLTLGYAIMIHRRCVGSRRILRRALGAVAEFELAGSLQAFLAGHLDEAWRTATADFPSDDQIPSHVRSALSPKSVSEPLSSA